MRSLGFLRDGPYHGPEYPYASNRIGFWTSYARQRGAAKDRREAATKKKAKKEGEAATPLKSHVYEPSEVRVIDTY